MVRFHVKAGHLSKLAQKSEKIGTVGMYAPARISTKGIFGARTIFPFTVSYLCGLKDYGEARNFRTVVITCALLGMHLYDRARSSLTYKQVS